MEINKNYPGKIRELVDESRELRDKNKGLEDRLRFYEEQKKQAYNEMLTLEDRQRELRARLSNQLPPAKISHNSGADNSERQNLIRKV